MLFDCTQVSVETTVGRWVERCGSDGLAVGVRLNPAYVIEHGERVRRIDVPTSGC